MNRLLVSLLSILFVITTISTAYSDNSAIIIKLDSIMKATPDNGNYHVTSMQLNKWINMKKDDFLVVDIRLVPETGDWGGPKHGKIPGSIHIPYTEIFKPENMKKLPKDKKLIFAGHMNVHENYLVVPMRLIGYESYSLLLGMSGWQKDYPATGHINMLINAADKMNFPLEMSK